MEIAKSVSTLSVYFSCLVRLGFIIGNDTVRCSIVRFMLVHWFIDMANMLTNVFWGQNGAYHIKDNYHFLCVRWSIDRSKIQRFLFPWIKTHKFICIYFSTSQIPGFGFGYFLLDCFRRHLPFGKISTNTTLPALLKIPFLPGIIHSLWIGSDASLGIIQLWLRKANATIVIKLIASVAFHFSHGIFHSLQISKLEKRTMTELWCLNATFEKLFQDIVVFDY